MMTGISRPLSLDFGLANSSLDTDHSCLSLAGHVCLFHMVVLCMNLKWLLHRHTDLFWCFFLFSPELLNDFSVKKSHVLLFLLIISSYTPSNIFSKFLETIFLKS